jgi:hypothetical protein
MKRILALALLAMLVAVALPGLAEARAGGGGFRGGGGGWHGGGFRGGFGGFHHGFRGGGFGYGFYPGYYAYGGCWRWVPWPYWHRAYVCY